MEATTSFISSRGLMKSCKAFNTKPVSSVDHIDTHILNDHGFNESIYICTDALLNFSCNFIDKIEHPFSLITGDSDTPITQNLIQHEAIKKILDNPYLINWFAQNLVVDHPKLHRLPIGLDYHTMWERNGSWGLVQQSPLAQERALMNTLASSSDFIERFFAGYCNWHFAVERGDRHECLSKIDNSLCLIERSHLPRISTWQRQAECMFVISPEGAGFDCHRTWEALLLGCIPVMKANKITPLFERLPVVILNDWSDFNATFMQNQLARLISEKFNFNSLFLKYWDSKFNNNKFIALPDMTLKEFKNLICENSF